MPGDEGTQQSPLQPGLGAALGVREDARATWAARFLNVGEHRGFVGGWLRRKLFMKEGGPLKVFSGHDYSILSLLAALGLSDYPEPALGFGAYVVVELHQSGSVDVKLNPAPFRDATNRVCASVDTSRVRPVVVEDVDLAEPPSDDAALGRCVLQHRST